MLPAKEGKYKRIVIINLPAPAHPMESSVIYIQGKGTLAINI